MSSSDDEKPKYRSLKPDTAPKSEDGHSLVDLYVYLPSNKKFIKWVPKGDPIEDSHVNKIKEHVDPNFYTDKDIANIENQNLSDTNHSENSTIDQETENQKEEKVLRFKSERQVYESARLVLGAKPKDSDAESNDGLEISSSIPGANHLDTIKKLFGNEKAELLTEPIDKELSDIYNQIGGSKPGNFTLQDPKLEELSDKICNIVSPEVGDVRSHLKNIPAFVSIMDESVAISTLAILFAVAQGQKTRGVFKDLSYACLLMDISLVGAPPDLKTKWMQAPESLTDEEKILIETHPRKSQAIVMEKFKTIPEIVGQLILGHHELFNGRGFPRKVRSDLLPPIVRVLSFAVDVHYHMKKAELNGQTLGVESVIESFMDPKIEPHLRRHNIDLCRKILKYTIEGET